MANGDSLNMWEDAWVYSIKEYTISIEGIQRDVRSLNISSLIDKERYIGGS